MLWDSKQEEADLLLKCVAVSEGLVLANRTSPLWKAVASGLEVEDDVAFVAYAAGAEMVVNEAMDTEAVRAVAGKMAVHCSLALSQSKGVQ